MSTINKERWLPVGEVLGLGDSSREHDTFDLYRKPSGVYKLIYSSEFYGNEALSVRETDGVRENFLLGELKGHLEMAEPYGGVYDTAIELMRNTALGKYVMSVTHANDEAIIIFTPVTKTVDRIVYTKPHFVCPMCKSSAAEMTRPEATYHDMTVRATCKRCKGETTMTYPRRFKATPVVRKRRIT